MIDCSTILQQLHYKKKNDTRSLSNFLKVCEREKMHFLIFCTIAAGLPGGLIPAITGAEDARRDDRRRIPMMFASAKGAPPPSTGLVCSWLCDDPVCEPTCEAECSQPVCNTTCSGGGIAPCNIGPSCGTVCAPAPANAVANSCPVCNVLCNPLPAVPQCSGCNVLCAQITCAWRCRKPTNCPAPLCELQCEQPACGVSFAAQLRPVLGGVAVLVLLSMMTL